MARKVKPKWTLEEAFADLFKTVIQKRGAHRKLGVTQGAMRQVRCLYRKGKLPRLRMKTLLHRAGYKIIQVELWA